jgi:hypothetical protein
MGSNWEGHYYGSDHVWSDHVDGNPPGTNTAVLTTHRDALFGMGQPEALQA